MEHLRIISHNSFRVIGFHKSRSPSSPYGPAPKGSQLIRLNLGHTWNKQFLKSFSAKFGSLNMQIKKYFKNIIFIACK